MEESAQCSAIIQSTSLNAPAQKEYFGRFCYKWRVRTYNVYPGLEIVFNAGSVFSAILTQQLRTRGRGLVKICLVKIQEWERAALCVRWREGLMMINILLPKLGTYI